ncbi:CaiB/BaiF CoA transferase family protein [Ornithinimicrobium cavernae]|uniref:CaiB/BaiF CoA transferase family protein n=1 Tax=Ornithinimicrobium cavernae TaxID=2666047 RepID=UPI000D691D39|nr:CoA transferase [Ornithinimicrobium cavernae]
MSTAPEPSATVEGGGRGPLDGILVVDLSRALSGPHAGMMLGDLGARVIKVEEPAGGDQSRAWGPFVGGESGERGTSTYFLSCNRNKESIALDLKDGDQRETLEALLRRADVLIENFRPGVMERLGLSTDRLLELNPGLVVLSISGFGHDGPESTRPGYDQIAQGEGGLMSMTGSSAADPQRVGVAISDVLAGMYGAYGVASALVERARTGRGQVVRTSLLASVVGVHAFQGTRWSVAGELPVPIGNHHPLIAPYGLFRCADGAVQIACGTDRHWVSLCGVLGLDPDADGFGDKTERVARRDELATRIEEVLAHRTGEEVLGELSAVGVPAGRVRNLQEVYAWEQTRSQGLVVEVDHSSLGPIELPGPPLRFFSPGPDGEVETTRVTHRPPPVLDADAAALREWLDADPAQPAERTGA